MQQAQNAWRLFLLEWQLAKHYHLDHALYLNAPPANPLLNRLLPSLLQIRACSLLDELLADVIAAEGIKVGKELRHDLYGHMAKGYDDYTVMAVSGHSSTRMLARYTHPTEERKADAIGSFELSPRVTTASHSSEAPSDELEELKELLTKSGGRQEARTPDLRVANAALSQLS